MATTGAHGLASMAEMLPGLDGMKTGLVARVVGSGGGPLGLFVSSFEKSIVGLLFFFALESLVSSSPPSIQARMRLISFLPRRSPLGGMKGSAKCDEVVNIFELAPSPVDTILPPELPVMSPW